MTDKRMFVYLNGTLPFARRLAVSPVPRGRSYSHSGCDVPQGIPVLHPVPLLKDTRTQLTQVLPSTVARCFAT